MYKFHANIAVLMNITPDHLDRYDHQMQNYVDAKFRIIQNQTPDDAFIFWNDDPIIQRELHKYGIHGHYYPFAKERGRNRRIRGTGQGLFYRTNRFQHGTGGTGADRNP